MPTKVVRVTVRQKPGKVGEDGTIPIYSNVVKVDTAEDVDDDDLV
jgi:hypothetical protein